MGVKQIWVNCRQDRQEALHLQNARISPVQLRPPLALLCAPIALHLEYRSQRVVTVVLYSTIYCSNAIVCNHELSHNWTSGSSMQIITLKAVLGSSTYWGPTDKKSFQ